MLQGLPGIEQAKAEAFGELHDHRLRTGGLCDPLKQLESSSRKQYDVQQIAFTTAAPNPWALAQAASLHQNSMRHTQVIAGISG
jgi:hypothetical protein